MISQVENISLEIWEPNPLIVAIPEKDKNFNTFIQINIFIDNKASTSFPFIDNCVSLELLDENEKVLKAKLIREEVTSQEYYGIIVPPKKAIVRDLVGKLYWQNDSLKLDWLIAEKSTQILEDYQYRCSLEIQKIEQYQLQLIYSNPFNNFFIYDLHTKKKCFIGESRTKILSSNYIDFRLKKSLKSNKNALEIDRIEFQTVIEQKDLNLPLIKSESKIPILIGMLITNHSEIPSRFVLFDSLIPRLMGVNGLISGYQTGCSTGWRSPLESDFYLLMPQKQITLSLDAYLERCKNDLFRLVVPGYGRAVWIFENLKANLYQIQLTYRSPIEKDDFSGLLFEDIWIGKIFTFWVEFNLALLA